MIWFLQTCSFLLWLYATDSSCEGYCHVFIEHSFWRPSFTAEWFITKSTKSVQMKKQIPLQLGWPDIVSKFSAFKFLEQLFLKYITSIILLQVPFTLLIYKLPFTMYYKSLVSQNVSVKLQLEKPQRLFIIACQICTTLMWAHIKNIVFNSKCKLAAASTPIFPEEGRALQLALHIVCQQQNVQNDFWNMQTVIVSGIKLMTLLCEYRQRQW